MDDSISAEVDEQYSLLNLESVAIHRIQDQLIDSCPGAAIRIFAYATLGAPDRHAFLPPSCKGDMDHLTPFHPRRGVANPSRKAVHSVVQPKPGSS